VLFDTWQYVLFLPAVVILHYLLPFRHRWSMLLVASCYFYMVAIPLYILILLLLIVIDYTAGRMIAGGSGVWRKAWLIASIVASCSVLGVFKYWNFFAANVENLLDAVGIVYDAPPFSWVLPIGLSFHTFQSLSYVIEVYYGRQTPVTHFGRYALYVMFFPQLVAGPIERPGHLLPQFLRDTPFEAARAASGMRMILWGLFKKVVVADRLALIVNTVYESPGAYPGPALLVGTLAFGYQVYCDFSGYSDIAIGSARLLGFELMENFRRPYHARDIQGFWSRWHMSLTQWFRDYVYIPLGGSRVPVARRIFNALAVFLLSGIWHGANWTFLVWGLLHGLYYVAFILSAPTRAVIRNASGLARFPRLDHAAAWLLTFLAVNFAWIFFRADSISDAFYIIHHLFSGWDVLLSAARIREVILWPLSLDRYELGILAGSLLVLEIGDTCAEREGLWSPLLRRPVAIRWLVYAALALAVMNFGIAEEIPFVYFQF
jgi:alginate O-acetyltransferase complex protein AlgI